MNPQQDNAPGHGPDSVPQQPQVFGPQQTPVNVPVDSAISESGTPSPGQPSSAPSPVAASLSHSPAANSRPQGVAPTSFSSPSHHLASSDQQQIPTNTQPAHYQAEPGSVPFMSSTPQATVAQKRRFSGKKLFVAVAAVLLLGLGGSAYAYISIMNNSPEKVLADALANTMTDMLDGKPLQAVSNMKIEFEENGQPIVLTIDMDTKLVGENGAMNAKVRVEAGPLLDISASGSVVAAGNTMYLRLNDVQKTVNDIVRMDPQMRLVADEMRPLIQKIDGQWIKIDEQSIAKYGLVETDKDLGKCTQALTDLRISEQDKKRVKEIFKNNQFAVASEELPDESIDGDSSYHYKLDLNQEAGVRFIKDFIELESFSRVKADCEIKFEDIEKELDQIKKQADKEASVKPVFELWVSKKHRYPTKAKVSLDDKKATLEWTTDTKINAENLSVDIPTDAMSIEQFEAEVTQILHSNTGQGMTRGWSAWRQN